MSEDYLKYVNAQARGDLSEVLPTRSAGTGILSSAVKTLTGAYKEAPLGELVGALRGLGIDEAFIMQKLRQQFSNAGVTGTTLNIIMKKLASESLSPDIIETVLAGGFTNDTVQNLLVFSEEDISQILKENPACVHLMDLHHKENGITWASLRKCIIGTPDRPKPIPKSSSGAWEQLHKKKVKPLKWSFVFLNKTRSPSLQSKGAFSDTAFEKRRSSIFQMENKVKFSASLHDILFLHA